MKIITLLVVHCLEINQFYVLNLLFQNSTKLYLNKYATKFKATQPSTRFRG